MDDTRQSRSRPSLMAPWMRTLHPWLTAQEAPLYRLTYPRTRTLLDLQRAHESVALVYAQSIGPLAWLVDGREVREATARERKLVAEHEQAIRGFAETRCVGLAVVAPNALVRGIFTAVTWMSPLTYPHRIFSDLESAERWAREQLGGRQRSG